MRKPLLAASLLLLTLSAIFGFLNNGNVKSLRVERNGAVAASHVVDKNARTAQLKDVQEHEAYIGDARAKLAEMEARVTNVEAELAKSQSEKTTLQTSLQTKQSEMAQLQKGVEELARRLTTAEATPGPSATQSQAQLQETRTLLDDVKREKTLLSERILTREERSPQTSQERMRHRNVISQPAVHGTVMAVNQAYNFIVLDLGHRQGVEPNSEMLVLRGGTLIARIRISSVEPATAIGDIISSSLAPGVQVQSGDTVIYADTN